MNTRVNNNSNIHSTADDIPSYDPMFGYREIKTIDFTRYHFSLKAVLMPLFDLPSELQNFLENDGYKYAWVSEDFATACVFNQRIPAFEIRHCPKINYIHSKPERRIYPYVIASVAWWDQLRALIS